MKKRLLCFFLAAFTAFSVWTAPAAAADVTASAASQTSESGTASSESPVSSEYVPVQNSDATYTPDFNVGSTAALLMSLDTGTVLYSKNADQKMYPASTTKIMTYMVVMDHVTNVDTETVTYTEEMESVIEGTGSSVAGMEVGDVFTVHQLLYCMMVPSGNDAAVMLASYVGNGDLDAFVQMMNDKAAELGCENTHFANPDGLHDPDHYTTARDMAKITQAALSYNYFQEIVNTTTYYATPQNRPDVSRMLSTTNYLIDRNQQGQQYWYQYARGVKTGHTDEAGHCLVSTAVAEGQSYLCVVMGDFTGNRCDMTDTRSLYRWAYRNFQLKKVASANMPVGEVKLAYAWNQDTLRYEPETDVSAVLPNDVAASSVVLTPSLPDEVEAPVQKGQVIGTATLMYANQTLATVNLVASESVERSQVVYSANTIGEILTSPWFILIGSVILLLVVIYIILALIYSRNKRNMKKVKKYKDF